MRTKYEVSYDSKMARFSDYLDAMVFAKRASETIKTLTEVSDATGLIGQFSRGTPTAEFEQHWEQALDEMAALPV